MQHWCYCRVRSGHSHHPRSAERSRQRAGLRAEQQQQRRHRPPRMECGHQQSRRHLRRAAAAGRADRLADRRRGRDGHAARLRQGVRHQRHRLRLSRPGEDLHRQQRLVLPRHGRRSAGHARQLRGDGGAGPGGGHAVLDRADRHRRQAADRLRRAMAAGLGQQLGHRRSDRLEDRRHRHERDPDRGRRPRARYDLQLPHPRPQRGPPELSHPRRRLGRGDDAGSDRRRRRVLADGGRGVRGGREHRHHGRLPRGGDGDGHADADA